MENGNIQFIVDGNNWVVKETCFNLRLGIIKYNRVAEEYAFEAMPATLQYSSTCRCIADFIDQLKKH